jgi:hypothetical protein
MFSNKLYDILSKIQRWLPAVGVLYLALCTIWNLPYGQQINNTIIAVATFLAATLEISTGIYHKDVTTQILTDAFRSEAFYDEPTDNVPSEDGPNDAE